MSIFYEKNENRKKKRVDMWANPNLLRHTYFNPQVMRVKIFLWVKNINPLHQKVWVMQVDLMDLTVLPSLVVLE